jgi:hypothetical protein
LTPDSLLAAVRGVAWYLAFREHIVPCPQLLTYYLSDLGFYTKTADVRDAIVINPALKGGVPAPENR